MDIFTRAQWRAGGRSSRALDRALATGHVRRVIRNAYAWSDVPDTTETRARAVALVRPRDTVACRCTAAWLSDLDVLPPGQCIADEPLRLLVGTEVTPPRITGCVAYQADVPDRDLIEEHGVTRTSDARTALDLARFAPRHQAVAAVDTFLNKGRVLLTELWERARLLTRVRNCRRLRANLAVADAGAQSYAESVERVLFIDAGLPRPETQIAVYDLSGRLLGYLDLGWRRFRLASEYDGEEHHDGADNQRADAIRRALIEREASWTVDVVRKGDLWGRPAALVARTAVLLRERGWEPANPLVLDQISRAAEFEARTGQRWKWMPLDRLLAA
jgi:hypothetical protein